MAKQVMDYSKFSLEDFICDGFFQDWVLHPGEETKAFWENWIGGNPGKREIVAQAARILQEIKFAPDLPTEEQAQNALLRNLRMIDAGAVEGKPEGGRVISIKRFGGLRKMAAIFIGVMMIATVAYYYAYRHAVTVVATNYGEIKTIVLPDSSMIILNAHSTLKYVAHWQKEQRREVWLEGEAFFKVTHLPQNTGNTKGPEIFLVHTKDMNIAVLGTSFDVRNRGEKTAVVLKTGKIKIVFKNKRFTDIVMKPGDLISYNAATRQLVRSSTDAEGYVAWTDKKLILTDATVSDIAQYIADNYGYKVSLEDTAIGNRKMEGTMRLDNLQDVLFVLSTALNVEIIQQGDTLIFKNR